MKEKNSVISEETSCSIQESEDCCGSMAGNEEELVANKPSFNVYIPAIFSFLFLIIGILLDYLGTFSRFSSWIRILWYAVAYIPVGLPVMKEGWKSIKNGDFFTEFLLMSIATIGAFIIGQYPEGVAVMLFYAVGELFQASAVKKLREISRPCWM